MSDIDYKLKYFKYKNKYLNLKNNINGGKLTDNITATDLYFINSTQFEKRINNRIIFKAGQYKVTKKNNNIALKIKNVGGSRFQPWLTLIDNITALDIRVSKDTIYMSFQNTKDSVVLQTNWDPDGIQVAKNINNTVSFHIGDKIGGPYIWNKEHEINTIREKLNSDNLDEYKYNIAFYKMTIPIIKSLHTFVVDLAKELEKELGIRVENLWDANSNHKDYID